MKGAFILFPIAALVPAAGPAQSVPSQEKEGPAEMCGITAAGPLVFEKKVRSDAAYRERDRSALYTLFSGFGGLRQWAFATRENPAYPAATCRLACEGPKIECDRVYLQFKSVDERLTEALRKD